MTERLTLAEFQEKYGDRAIKKTKPKGQGLAKRKQEIATQTLIGQLERAYGIDGIVREHQFAKERGRKYRLDLAIPEHKIGLEIHGGAYVRRTSGGIGGAHHTIEGRARDMAKGNLAAVMGWIVIEVSPKELADGTALGWLVEALTFRLGDTWKQDIESGLS